VFVDGFFDEPEQYSADHHDGCDFHLSASSSTDGARPEQVKILNAAARQNFDLVGGLASAPAPLRHPEIRLRQTAEAKPVFHPFG
jgi:hypothetical protein